MFRLLKFIFTGSWHQHEWEIIKNGDVIHENKITGKELTVGNWYVLQCKTCGNIKQVEV